MAEITLSLFHRGQRVMTEMRGLLDEFERSSGHKVHLDLMTWEEGRPALNRIAFDRRGPDVSESGTTWTGDIVAMNALRPFTSDEIRLMGGTEAYIPASWMPGLAFADERIWAAPWVAETFIIHYRKDLLSAVGLDPVQVFASSTNIEEAVIRLAATEIEIPISPSLGYDIYGMLHCMAAYIWDQGGAFISADGKRVLFDEPQARQGMKNYFGLLRHLTPRALETVRQASAWEYFLNGRTAIAFGSQGILRDWATALPEVRENWGLTAFPPASFIGGSNLLVWRHTRQERASVELVRYLTQHSAQISASHITGTLPARISALDSDEFTLRPFGKELSMILRNGRAYPSMPLWGLTEERLVHGLQMAWDLYYQQPGTDVDEILDQTIGPLARRLSVTLQQYERGSRGA